MKTHTPWTLLLVDDEEDVIAVSRLVLDDLEFDGRPVRILTASSAGEAVGIFERENIAVAFIDVVMETEHAGLELVKYVRETLGNQITRLILRTGNPGAAPAHEIVRHLEIDDYKEKTELTAERLETAVLTSLRSYRNLTKRLKMEAGLERMLEASAALHSSISTLDLLRVALGQIAAVVQIELEEEEICGAMVLRPGEGGMEILTGLLGHEQLEGLAQDNHLPADLLQELCSLDSTEGVHPLGSGVVFTIPVHHSNTYHFWVGLSHPLSADAVRLIRFFLGKLSVSLSNSILQREVLEAQTSVLNRLCEAVESRSKETGSHIRRIAMYSRKLAVLAGLNSEAVEIITLAAPMHDIGKVAIPDRILNKPGKLDAEEWAIMQTHAAEGFRLLAHPDFGVMQAGAEIAITHHERWDGTGYPKGLAGEQIPIMGRIVALVDVFDALLSKRAYKEAWPLEQVAEQLRGLRSTHFDPALVDIFLENMESFHGIFQQFPDQP